MENRFRTLITPLERRANWRATGEPCFWPDVQRFSSADKCNFFGNLIQEIFFLGRKACDFQGSACHDIELILSGTDQTNVNEPS